MIKGNIQKTKKIKNKIQILNKKITIHCLEIKIKQTYFELYNLKLRKYMTVFLGYWT